MEKLYLPQDFTGILEDDLKSYEDLSTTAFAIGYTKNNMIEMKTGIQYKDSLNANLTTITWIEDSIGYFNTGETKDQPYIDRFIKICTFYIDKGGFIVDGFYRSIKYYGRIERQPNMPYDARVEKKIRDEYNVTRNFKSKGMDLHKEIFIDGLLRIDDFEDSRINPKSIFFKLIKEVSIFNRCFDMNYIYAIAHEEKEALEKAKRYVGIAALPFAISGGVFVKALQSSVALVSYFCDIDSTFRLSDKLFKFKGPVVISDVYWKNWRNYMTTDDNWDKKWQTPTLDPAYDSNDLGSKKDALEKFENLKTIFNFK